MKNRTKEFGDKELDIFPELINQEVIAHKTITFQVTEDCSLRCKYCYQGCKKPNYMDFDTAKKFIDYIFDNMYDDSSWLNVYSTKAIIIEFIGGEPLLCIDLIRKISDYFTFKFIEYPDCPWALHHRFSICSNGVAYFEPKVQEYINEYNEFLSMSITIDGCKELHDKCRVFPDGSPSYDIAIKAALDLLSRGVGSTKITQSPDNIQYTAQGIINMIELGFTEIMINPVFEEGWELKHAQTLYSELKKVSNYIVEHGLQDKVYIRLFDTISYNNRYSENEDKNWCGSTSSMCSLDYKGIIYPCIRFMESSLNGDAEPYRIGDIDNGIATLDSDKGRLHELYSLKKSEQSTEECLNCPIESGCGWCTGYNYQHFGTICHRATYICGQHKASALSSLYFYKLCKDKESYDKIEITKDIALEIISEDEWNSLQWEE